MPKASAPSTRPRRQPIADPPRYQPLPDDLLHIPGFVDQVMNFSLAGAPYPNPVLAFCGALTLQSYLYGRKVCDPVGTRPNLYLLVVAHPGLGSQYPRQVNTRILGHVGDRGFFCGGFARSIDLERTIRAVNPVFCQGEFVMPGLRHNEAIFALPRLLLDVYDGSHSVLALPRRVKQTGSRQVIEPYLTQFGIARPFEFYEALHGRQLDAAVLARHIVTDAGKRGRGQEPRRITDLPQQILNIAHWWAHHPASLEDNDSKDFQAPKVQVVPWTDRAKTLIEAFGQQCDAAGECREPMIWIKACELARKLALLYACSREPIHPVIDHKAMAWAIAFARHQAHQHTRCLLPTTS